MIFAPQISSSKFAVMMCFDIDFDKGIIPESANCPYFPIVNRKEKSRRGPFSFIKQHNLHERSWIRYADQCKNFLMFWNPLL